MHITLSGVEHFTDNIANTPPNVTLSYYVQQKMTPLVSVVTPLYFNHRTGDVALKSSPFYTSVAEKLNVFIFTLYQ
jgi:hypothetical protein